jgi:hypothetical protein
VKGAGAASAKTVIWQGILRDFRPHLLARPNDSVAVRTGSIGRQFIRHVVHDSSQIIDVGQGAALVSRKPLALSDKPVAALGQRIVSIAKGHGRDYTPAKCGLTQISVVVAINCRDGSLQEVLIQW